MSSDPEKMSALDFVLSVLKEHEKNLDSIAEKFEKVANALEKVSGTLEKEEKIPIARVHNVSILCEDWGELAEACQKPEIVCFQLGDELTVKALKGNVIYEYKEHIRGQAQSLECGIPVTFQTRLDPSKVKRFLSRELEIPIQKIVKGEVNFAP